MKLLIIEDDIAFAKALVRRLEKYKYQCWQVDNCSDALLACHRHQPDHILLDMKLNNESGLSIISPIRKILPHCRIILLTGYASIATAVDAIKLGADDYLSKPVDSKTLLAALNNCHVNDVDKVSKGDVHQQEEETLSAEQVQWEHIQQILKFNNGNISATARQLSMHRRTLQRKLLKRASK